MSRASPTVNDIIRVGRVSAVFPARHTVTVEFPDRERFISKELPVAVSASLKNHGYGLPDPGEHVVCAFFGNGLSEGIVLARVYDTNNPPPCSDKDKFFFEAEGGAHVLFDRKKRIVQICGFEGEFIKIQGGSIYIESSGGFLDLNLHEVSPEMIRGGNDE